MSESKFIMLTELWDYYMIRYIVYINMPVIDGVLPEMEYGDTSRRPSLKTDGVLQY